MGEDFRGGFAQGGGAIVQAGGLGAIGAKRTPGRAELGVIISEQPGNPCR